MVKKKEILEKVEAVNEAITLKLEDMEGIGPVRLKKLYANGIYTVDDLLSYGEEALSRMLDISWDDAKKMTQVANESLNTEDVFSSIVETRSRAKSSSRASDEREKSSGNESHKAQ